MNDIKALYNGGNQILQVQSPMQLTGDIWCSQLDRIQTTQGNIYADETLGLWETFGRITLTNLLAAYAKCGFDPGGDNNFFPQTNGGRLVISDMAKSWDIYRLFERYYDKGKLDNLSHLIATGITVAGNSVAGLYDANNQPSSSFVYKVNGVIINDMYGKFRGFENL